MSEFEMSFDMAIWQGNFVSLFLTSDTNQQTMNINFVHGKEDKMTWQR